MKGFGVLATNHGTKEKTQDNHPLECCTLYDRLLNFPTLFPKARDERMQVLKARCSSDDSFKGS